VSEAVPRSQRPSLLSIALLAGGALLVGLAFAADLLGFGGAAGMGGKQLGLALAGLGAAAAGAVLATRGREARARAAVARAFHAAPRIRPGTCLSFAIAAGILTGFVEVLHQLARKVIADLILKQPDEMVWMVPVSYLLVFGVLGLLLALLVRLWPHTLRLPIALFPVLMLAAWSQIRLHPLNDIARLLLCAGIAAQLCRVCARHPEGTARFARRALPISLALVALAIVGVPGVHALREARALAAQPAAPAHLPNVLLIVLDTVRADHLASYGYERETAPRVDQLAREGAVFERVFSTSPWTLPSHVAMFTGRYGYEISVEWLKALDDTHPTLAEILTARGYATAGFAGNLVYCLREQGIARGFTHYEDFQIEPGVFALSSSLGRWFSMFGSTDWIAELARNDAPTITRRFLRWLPSAKGRPFFAFLNFFDAHAPYRPPPPFDTAFGPARTQVVQRFVQKKWSQEEIRGFIDAYDSSVLAIDASIREMLEQMRAQGLLENTLIVITADHGEQFGEHGLLDHGNSLYRPLLHVPLILWWPGHVPAGLRIPQHATLRDFPATILDLTGIAPPGTLPGKTLARLFDAQHRAEPDDSPLLSEVKAGINTPPWEPIAKGYMASLIEAGLHLIENGDGSVELYELESDPREERDLTSSRPADAARLRQRLEEALRAER
jgi:arylsulfatase A-like enzyme